MFSPFLRLQIIQHTLMRTVCGIYDVGFRAKCGDIWANSKNKNTQILVFVLPLSLPQTTINRVDPSKIDIVHKHDERTRKAKSGGD
jgi:hypothetical protein